MQIVLLILLGWALPVEAQEHRGCVDLSGNFEYFDGKHIQKVEVKNLGCEKVQFARNDFSYFLTLDDQFVQISPVSYKKSRINAKELVEEYWSDIPKFPIQLTAYSSWILINDVFLVRRDWKVEDASNIYKGSVVYKRVP